MKILVVNVGSSSIKYQVFDMNDELVMAKGLLDRVGIAGTILEHDRRGKDRVVVKKDIADHTDGIKMILEVLVNQEWGCLQSLDEIQAIGHRVVHGGEGFARSVLITDAVKNVIRDCFAIAPLHNPPNLKGIEACQQVMPSIPQVAVFDTAFHQTMTPAHYLYALPYEVYTDYKIRRYGFHGTSHDYVSHQAAEMLGKPYDECKIITIHLGNGSSMAALDKGQVVDTTMGFTPLEGLVMGTRCGDIDPAIVYFLMDKLGLDSAQINDYLNKKSGMLGLSGVSSDMRDIIAAAKDGHERAQLSLDIFTNRVKHYIGAYIAKLNGCDGLVFTAGIGENGYDIRAAICANMEFLGIKIDVAQNQVRGQKIDVSAPDSRVKILVIPTNEELVIARDTLEMVK